VAIDTAPTYRLRKIVSNFVTTTVVSAMKKLRSYQNDKQECLERNQRLSKENVCWYEINSAKRELRIL
jgi:hypothetical protein